MDDWGTTYEERAHNAETQLAALRARVAELEGDLSVARLQLGARVCSECPAKARVAELEAALRAVAARLDQPVFRGDEKAGSAATARILRADIRSALVVAISAIDAARNAPIAGIGLPANKPVQQKGDV